MANLLSNAIKFSKKGSNVEISVRRQAGKVRILVKDNGMGIAQSSRHLVFGKFTQIDSSDQRRVGGTGLGMHITKQIVEKHRGHIDFESEIGQGTTFFVEFDERKSTRPANIAAPMLSGRAMAAAKSGEPGSALPQT